MEASSVSRARRALCIAILAAATITILAASPVSAQKIGPIRRDENGKIVPVNPLTPGQGIDDPIERRKRALKDIGRPPPAGDDIEPVEASRGLPLQASDHMSPFAALRPFYTPDRAALDRMVSQQQQRISQLVLEERVARQRSSKPDARVLTQRERNLEDQLAQRDREVHEHEQAHQFTAGSYAGTPEYWYVFGPSGQRYAIAGHVPIDLSPVRGDVEATIQKLQRLRRAAMAPRDPSARDREVAARIDSMVRRLTEGRPNGPAETR